MFDGSIILLIVLMFLVFVIGFIAIVIKVFGGKAQLEVIKYRLDRVENMIELCEYCNKKFCSRKEQEK